MKKILAIAASLILVVVSANSQTEKKDVPPPPPPKQVDEKVKFTPPKIVKDEEVNSSTKTKTEKNKKETPPKVNITKFKPPVIHEHLREFYKRNPSVANFSMKDNKVTLTLKDGQKEEYNFKNDDENNSFTEKYGNVPVPPPPPPKVKSKA